MTMFEQNPNYKVSGERWLGHIPVDWKTIKIKWLTSIKRGASPRPIDDPKYFDEQGEYAWVRIADVSKSKMYLDTTTQRMSELGSSLSVKREPGDIFLSIAGTVGKPCITNIKCCIHDGFVYFPNYKGDVRFLYYLFESGEPYKGLGKMGTQLNLNTDTVGTIVIPDINVNLQKAISDFLDIKTKEIDDLITNKEKLINLLEEKCQSIITEAVTKGLKPNVKMKNSGVDCIDKIPEHWDIKKIKHISTFVGSGKTPRGGSEIYPESGILFLRSMNVHYDGIRLKDIVHITPEIDEDMRSTRVKPKDVLLNITGASIGRSCIVPESLGKANVNQHVCIIRSDARLIVPELLSKIMSSDFIMQQILMSQNGSSREGLNFTQVKNLNFPLTRDLNEQIEIANYISVETDKLNSLINTIKKQIKKLREYRQSLIYEAVTGKIDVREFEVVS